VNLLHKWLCRSAYWKDVVGQRLPWALNGESLGPAVLEIGPGFGVTTDVLYPLAPNLTCVEIDRVLASSLRDRLRGTNVRVVCEDATALSMPDNSFSSVVCFTMLHHVPSAALQDRLLAEVVRVLRPGGLFIGADSLAGWRFRMLHVFDTMVVVDPATLPQRLAAAGLTGIDVETGPSAFRFAARKPGPL
jgi:SAM-dependent methyltransferase